MANKKVKRGFVHYIIFGILVLVGLFCVFLAILFFNPGKDVYGIGLRFVSYNSKIELYRSESGQYIADPDEQHLKFNKVVFNSNLTNFNISYDVNENRTKILVTPALSGITKTNKYSLSTTVLVDVRNSSEGDGIMTIDVQEPDLWIPFSKQATVSLVLGRKNLINDNLSVVVNTGSGNITLGDVSNNSYKIAEADISTKYGDVKIHENMTINGTVSIDSLKSNVFVNTNTSIPIKNMNLLKITNKDGKNKIGALDCSVQISSTGMSETSAEYITGNFSIFSKQGYVKINKLGDQNRLNSPLGYIFGNFTTTSDCELTNISIGSMVGDATITTTTGNVSIDTIAKNSLIKTTNGDVKVTNAFGDINIETVSGNVEIKQKTASKVDVTTKSGDITASYDDLQSSLITNYNSTLTSQSGNINLNLNEDLEVKFVYEAGKAVNCTMFNISDRKGFAYFPENQSNVTKVINITAGGTINIDTFLTTNIG